MNTLLKLRAIELYNEMPNNLKAVVKFGMTPADRAATLEAEFPDASISDIALAFINATKTDGGMIS